ncbi:DUF4112 domain-containing protein [Flammeovirgaceae bacterium SG7u.111]|nr:DUF4112 domain-containing protein [Flammeovirgaceae bacterium SG7u.132]WPO36589.1 DUF4112 domain-containing protein [Flammeovirgaceae bacterium SG7u.111]
MSHKTVEDLPEFKWIKRISNLMDEAIRIPGTNIRFGLDPILGLVPGAGDYISMVISSLMVLGIVRQGISGKVVVMMLGNVLVDFLVGSVPVIGDLFDFAYKANSRNYRLLLKHYEEGKHKGSGCGLVLLVVGFTLALLGFGFFLSWKILSWLSGMVG